MKLLPGDDGARPHLSRPAWINRGDSLSFARVLTGQNGFYRRATEIDPSYCAGVFRSGQRARRDSAAQRVDCRLPVSVALAPGYADATTTWRWPMSAGAKRARRLRHWQAYARLDKGARGPITHRADSQAARPREAGHRLARRRASFAAQRKQPRSNWSTARPRLIREFLPISCPFPSKNSPKRGENRIFPVIFRGQISRCGVFWL